MRRSAGLYPTVLVAVSLAFASCQSAPFSEPYEQARAAFEEGCATAAASLLPRLEERAASDKEIAAALLVRFSVNLDKDDLTDARAAATELWQRFPDCFETGLAGTLLAIRQARPARARALLRGALVATRDEDAAEAYCGQLDLMLDAIEAFRKGGLIDMEVFLSRISSAYLRPAREALAARLEGARTVMLQQRLDAYQTGVREGLAELQQLARVIPELVPTVQSVNRRARTALVPLETGASPIVDASAWFEVQFFDLCHLLRPRPLLRRLSVSR